MLSLRNSTKGLLDIATELSKGYIRSKVRISHILEEENLVSVHY
jgi:hypothetical protein